MEQKQNFLIWSAYYWNKSKTFEFCPKHFFPQADCLSFGPKILGLNKAIWFGLEFVLGKEEHFYFTQKLMYWIKTFWFGLLIIGTKTKHFEFVQNKLFHKQIVSILAQKFWDDAKQFEMVWNCLKQNRTFLFNQKTYRLKQNVLIWSAYYQNESKTFCLVQFVPERQQNNLIWSKNYLS